jgi:hypothetical protein
VLKKITRSSTLLLSLTLLAVPAGRIYAQTATPPTIPQPSTVTGGDPEPIGEPQMLFVLLSALVTL